MILEFHFHLRMMHDQAQAAIAGGRLKQNDGTLGLLGLQGLQRLKRRQRLSSLGKIGVE